MPRSRCIRCHAAWVIASLAKVALNRGHSGPLVGASACEVAFECVTQEGSLAGDIGSTMPASRAQPQGGGGGGPPGKLSARNPRAPLRADAYPARAQRFDQLYSGTAMPRQWVHGQQQARAASDVIARTHDFGTPGCANRDIRRERSGRASPPSMRSVTRGFASDQCGIGHEEKVANARNGR